MNLPNVPNQPNVPKVWFGRFETVFTEFSARTRQLNLQPREPFDILVVGGGITGAGIARDAMMRGFKTALIDKGDFACGTSSKSSKLVHGGVRYLETFEFGLVFEASRERRVLWNIAPDLAKPLPFLFPVYRDSKLRGWMINLGLWAYDALALFRNFRNHEWLSNDEITRRMRGLDTVNISGAAHYYDGQVDDARHHARNDSRGASVRSSNRKLHPGGFAH